MRLAIGPLRPALVLLALLLAAPPASGQAPEVSQAPQGDAGAEALARHLRLGTGTLTERAADHLVVLASFYRDRQMAPLWLDADGPSPRAETLAAVLRAADQPGLDPEHYDASIIADLLTASTPEQRAELELRLSLALIEITSDLASGRLEPSEVDPELFIHPQEVDPAEVIRAAAAAPDIAAFVAGFEPAQPEYQRLKAALADYRALAAAGGWTTIQDGPTLKPGTSGPRVMELRQRLGMPVAPGGDRLLFDGTLAEAVAAFQGRHGLEQDGLVGQNTLAALNVPVEERVQQMLLNMERRRWMPDDPGVRYVFVNLADFELKVVDGPKTVFEPISLLGT
jgi:murein L,D-transpeptidase YcbB/YkuD